MSVCVTGLGLISAIGMGKEESLKHLLAEKSGLAPLQWLETSHKGNFFAGEVKYSNESLSAVLKREDEALSRTTLLGLIAAQEAVEQAGFERLGQGDRSRTALISSSTVGGMSLTEQHYQAHKAGERSVDFMKSHDAADSTEYLAKRFGIQTQVGTINTACSSSANAIILGARMIEAGLADRAIVGGTDAMSCFTVNGFKSLGLLDPEACKPFDRNRKGINLGEGAAYLVLESEKAAADRPVIARLKGYGIANDAYHQSAMSPKGRGLHLSMQRALQKAGLSAQEIQYLNAHGTATLNNDLSEGHAIDALFDKDQPYVSSTKSFTGHTLAAAGVIEAALSILALNDQFIIPNLNYSQEIEEHRLRPVQKGKTAELKHVMTNSAAMGGGCSSIIFSN